VKHKNTFALWSTLLLALTLAGCVATPRTRAVEQDSEAGYRLGITMDADLRVVAIDPSSAATKAGVEVGDQLIDLTWVLSEAPEGLTTAAEDGGTGPVSTTVLRPPPGVEFKTVPFTAPDDIRAMISYGLPLRLQVARAGEVQALTITPAPPDAAADGAQNEAPERYF
jgi:hypothetical protein